MKKQRQVLSQAEFDQLLSWLGPDHDKAGEKYESVRQSLIELFEAWHCCEPDERADETINRVVSKLNTIVVTYSGDPALFFYGVAKMVRHEYLRKIRALELSKEPAAEPTHEPDDEKELLHQCLDECLAKLPPKDKDLVLMYYEGDKRKKIDIRKRLRMELDLSSNTLRVKVHRIRGTLEQCILRCLERANDGNKSVEST
jgi:DNA-directed RNA polymerase specialized sigma24 family protein